MKEGKNKSAKLASKDAEKVARMPRWLRWTWHVMRAGSWLLLLTAVAWGAREAQRYLLDDPRFVMVGEFAESADSADFVVQGITHTSRDRVVRVFADDFGKNISLVPIEERRRMLLAVDWVQDASVSRIWPNQLVVRIKERKPVAFLKLPVNPSRPASVRPAMIDADGVILNQPDRARFSFPILSGVSDRQKESERRERVRRMSRLFAEIGSAASQITEVDVSSPDLVAYLEKDGQELELLLGRTRFRERMNDFLSHYAEIHKGSPRATSFDLQIDGRITARN